MAETKKISTFVTLFWVGVFVVLLMGVFLVIFWTRLPPQLPWFYSLPWGEKQLINKVWFAWLLGGMEIVLVVSRAIARWAGNNDETVQNTIMIGAVATVFLMLASFIRVMKIFIVT